MRRCRHTLSVLRFTLHERRFTRKSSGSAIAAEALMNNAGEEGISEGFRLAKSERAVPGGVGAKGFATAPP